MKTLKTLFLFGLMAFAAADDNLYVLEKVDMAALASNIEEFKKFSDCLINKGPCSELHQSYKVLLPESLKQSCKKCTVEIKQIGYKFFEILKTNLPEDYILFKQTYDPENKYIEALEMELNKYKIV